MAEFPRLDFPDDDVHAWLDDEERLLYDAIFCRDLYAEISVSLKLAEEQVYHDEHRRWPGRGRLKVDGREERERLASGFLHERMNAYCSMGCTMRVLAATRRDLKKAEDEVERLRARLPEEGGAR